MALLACSLVAGALQAADSAPVPLEKFFQKPDVSGASLSPDGRFVALRILSSGGRSILNVVNADTHEQKVVANFSNADVDIFYWLSDMRLVYTVINVDQGGSIGSPGMYAVDRDGKDFKAMTRTIVAQRSFADNDFSSADYLAKPTINGFPYRQSDAMLAVARWEDRDMLTLVNTRSARRTDLRAPRSTYQWLLDADGALRIAVWRRDDKEVVSYKDDGGWRELAAFDPQGPDAFKPLLYVDGTLYVRARNGKDESSIYRYNIEKKALEDRPVITVPGYDANGYFVVNDKKMLGFRVNTDVENTVWFDDQMKAIQAQVDALLPDSVNTLTSGGHSATPYVVIDAHSDKQSHTYLLYNRETSHLLRLGAAYPDLDPARMAPMSMVRYPARDGMQIPAYITLPLQDPATQQPLPTVVLVGDTQWKRNGNWAWDAEVQFLASRGYVVLQPEPRGASGFGHAHQAAGVRQWGRAIQDDIADAVKWSVAQGHTDPARVCIAGTGYGGYAAMMGLLRDPALFKCGISWSGMTDISAMFARDWSDIAASGALAQLRNSVGDPQLDAVQFSQSSPLQNAARITQPVLLAYGKEDQRVPFSEGRKFYQALAATNRQVEWLEYTPGVEDWKTQANRIDLWRHIEAFLAKNIGK